MKNNITRIVAVASCAALLSGIVSGCGAKKETAKPGDKPTVVMWTTVGEDSEDWQKQQETLKDKMLEEKFPDINIKKVVAISTIDVRQEYDKALMAGKAPDIYDQFSYTDIPLRITNGTIADVTSCVDGWDMKKEGKVINTFDDVISKDGKWYGVPRSAYIKGTLANLKSLKNAGVDTQNLPATWDEFSEIGEKVTDMSIPRVGYEILGMDWCAWPFTAWVWSAGGEMVRKNSDGTYKIAFNEDAGVDAAVMLNDMIWKYKMTQKNVLCDIQEVGRDTSNGTACFSWNSYTDLDPLQLEQSGYSYADFQMMPMPVKDKSIKNPTLAGGEMLTFNPKASADVLEAAFKVGTYLYYDEDYLTQRWAMDAKRGKMDIDVPARKDLFEKKLSANTSLSEQMRKSIMDMSENTMLEPYCPHWTDIKSQLVNPLQEIFLSENITREKIKALLDDCAEKIYGLYPDTFRNN